MDKPLTIDEFHALLTTEPEKEDSVLLAALRKLTAIEKPENITVITEQIWGAWNAV